MTPLRREDDEDEEDGGGEESGEARHVCGQSSRPIFRSKGASSRRGSMSFKSQLQPCLSVLGPHSVREKSRVKHRIVSHRFIAETDGRGRMGGQTDGHSLERSPAARPPHSFSFQSSFRARAGCVPARDPAHSLAVGPVRARAPSDSHSVHRPQG